MTDKKTSNLEAINLSPLNTSKSKAMYSFSKASRFPDIKDLKYYLHLSKLLIVWKTLHLKQKSHIFWIWHENRTY